MSRPALLASFLLLSLPALAAEETEPLDGDFLEYLANLEGDEDNWTLLADADKDRSPPRKADDQANQTPKEPAKPAPDQR